MKKKLHVRTKVNATLVNSPTPAQRDNAPVDLFHLLQELHFLVYSPLAGGAREGAVTVAGKPAMIPADTTTAEELQAFLNLANDLREKTMHLMARLSCGHVTPAIVPVT
jgi:hypothetical protein